MEPSHAALVALLKFLDEGEKCPEAKDIPAFPRTALRYAEKQGYVECQMYTWALLPKGTQYLEDIPKVNATVRNSRKVSQ